MSRAASSRFATTAGALDFNLGCSGFIYGLGLAKGLIETGEARNVLLITAETYSKLLRDGDKTVRTIFGDGAAVTWIQGISDDTAARPPIGPFAYGTDGAGAEDLIVRTGGMRQRTCASVGARASDSAAEERSDEHLYMNGPKIFDFALRVVPEVCERVLQKAGKSMADIDLVVFHQANQYMLTHLRDKLLIPEEKFYISMSHTGNTVSATIPIALKHAAAEGRLRAGATVLLVGFGVGYSWGAAIVRWAN